MREANDTQFWAYLNTHLDIPRDIMSHWIGAWADEYGDLANHIWRGEEWYRTRYDPVLRELGQIVLRRAEASTA